MSSEKESIKIFAVGDIVPNRENPRTLYQLVSEKFQQGNVVTGALESVISDRCGYLDSTGWGPKPCAPCNIEALKEGNFNVISFASNNCLDYGPEAFSDTIKNLKENNIHVVGAGNDIEEARKPVILDINGTKIGFLAYNSICFKGYAARADAPGCLPMRAWTLYHQTEPEQPGTPCEVVTWANKEDLKSLLEDVKKLKPQVDVLCMHIHWGIHHVPKTIAAYQSEIAYAAIDAGVDVIFGHHPHILKGIEIYKGRTIFYSLNMFGFDWPKRKPRYGKDEDSSTRYGFTRDPEYPNFPFCHDALKTLVAKCYVEDKQIKKVTILPAYINKQNQPEILEQDDNRFAEVLDYVNEITRQQQLNALFRIDNDEVVVYCEEPSKRRWLPTIAIPVIDR